MTGRQLDLFSGDNAPWPGPPPKPPVTSATPLAAAIGPFRQYMLEREFATNTINSFLNDLSLYMRYVGPDSLLKDHSTHTLEGFIQYLTADRGAPCSPKSLGRRITTLKVFYGWLASHDILQSDPAAPLIHRSANATMPQVLTDEQVEKLLALTQSLRDAPEAPDARPHLLITLLLGTAIKKAECMRILLRQINVGDPGAASVYIHYDKPRQRHKSRQLQLPSDFAETLKLYLRRYQPRERLFECTPRNLEYVLHSISELANLPMSLTFEMLRYTSATRSLRRGIDPEHLRLRMGLSSISWRDTYPLLQKLAQGPL